jgi:hypothetical protein
MQSQPTAVVGTYRLHIFCVLRCYDPLGWRRNYPSWRQLGVGSFWCGDSRVMRQESDRRWWQVVASERLYHAVAIQRMLCSPTFRPYSSQDVVGVQLGGALKNPLASECI